MGSVAVAHRLCWLYAGGLPGPSPNRVPCICRRILKPWSTSKSTPVISKFLFSVSHSYREGYSLQDTLKKAVSYLFCHFSSEENHPFSCFTGSLVSVALSLSTVHVPAISQFLSLLRILLHVMKGGFQFCPPTLPQVYLPSTSTKS